MMRKQYKFLILLILAGLSFTLYNRYQAYQESKQVLSFLKKIKAVDLFQYYVFTRINLFFLTYEKYPKNKKELDKFVNELGEPDKLYDSLFTSTPYTIRHDTATQEISVDIRLYCSGSRSRMNLADIEHASFPSTFARKKYVQLMAFNTRAKDTYVDRYYFFDANMPVFSKEVHKELKTVLKTIVDKYYYENFNYSFGSNNNGKVATGECMQRVTLQATFLNNRCNVSFIGKPLDKKLKFDLKALENLMERSQIFRAHKIKKILIPLKLTTSNDGFFSS